MCRHPPRRRQHRAAPELLRRRREEIERDRESDYCHLMIPMYFDPFRYPASVAGTATEDPETGEPFQGNDIGWIACWRGTSKSVGKQIVILLRFASRYRRQIRPPSTANRDHHVLATLRLIRLNM
jgi:hypothetical protein